MRLAALLLVLAAGGCASPAPPPPGSVALERLGLDALPRQRLERDGDPLAAALRVQVFPGTRRDDPVGLCVDAAVQADLTALGGALDASSLRRAERAALLWEALAAEAALREPFLAWLREQPGVSGIEDYRGLARTCFVGSERVALAAVERDDVLRVQHAPRRGSPAGGEAAPGGLRPALPGDRWALEALGVPAARERGLDGGGVLVAVLDSDVPPEHPALPGRSAEPEAAVPARRPPRTHGLQVIAAAVGVDGLGAAPGARWAAEDPIPHDVLDARALAASVERLLCELRPDVVVAPWDAPPGAPTGGLERAFGVLRTAGAACVFPAGNTGPAPGRNRPPANLPALAPDGAPAFSVGGVDRALAASPDSNRGPSAVDGSLFPQVVAPSVAVALANPGGRGAVLGDGTSFAAGFAAGALALVLEAQPELTGPEAEALLRRTARDLGEPGPDPVFGHGLIDLAAATR